MSLIAWYPLNNDFRNQGTLSEANNIIVKTEPSFSNNGKLGKGLTTGGFNWSAETTTKILKRHQFTMCMWVYTPTTSTGYGSDTSDEASTPGGNLLFGNDSRRRFSIFRFPTRNDFHWSWSTDVKEYPNIITGGAIKGIFPNDTWVHIAIVYDCPNAYLYVNGKYNRQLCNNYNIDDITFDDTQVVPSRYNRMVNDYRFYDKALSATEIKEIAKGLMLHYTFENPYAEETTNIPHTFENLNSTSGSEITLGSDSTGNYIIKNGMTTWSGLIINHISVKPGRYYTWSIEVMPIKDIEYVIDGNGECSNSSHASSNDIHYDVIRGYSHINHKLDGSDTLPKGKLEAYKWTRIYFTVKVKQDCTNPKLFHTFVPYIPSGDSSVKVYYRNSQLEERMYDSPYTSSNREAGLIRDNSGMGNDGTQVYQREKIPIISSPAPGNGMGQRGPNNN